MALKLDMTKAYDRKSWMHIIAVLRRFGFGKRFIDMVWRLVSNVWFSILINGVSHGFLDLAGVYGKGMCFLLLGRRYYHVV